MEENDDAGAPSLAGVINVRNVEEALEIQSQIRSLVKIPDAPSRHNDISCENADEVIIALDVAYSTKSDLTVASGVVWDCTSSRVIFEKVNQGQVSFPYHPGLLAFREIPLLIDIVKDIFQFLKDHGWRSSLDEKVHQVRIIILCDGAGIAHPQFCGIACHLGILFNVASIGVAKNHLAGNYDADDLASERGACLNLELQNRIVGSVLRSQTSIRPIFVSPGHLISVLEAKDAVLQLCHKFRLPEPIRRADHIGRIELRRIEEGK